MKKLLLAMVLVVGMVSSGWATTYDLPTYGSTASITGSVGGTAIATEFTEAMQDTTSGGTGVIQPFLTIQNNGTEQGMNTDGATIYDQKRSGSPGEEGFTHSLTYGQLGTFTASSTTESPGGYFNFIVDVNQTAVNYIIPLTQFQVFLVPNSFGGSLTTYSQLTTYGTKMFDMGDNQLNIDYELWKGSGNNLDVLFQIPTFSGNSNDYIYLWTSMGTTGNPANDGFEEWIAQTGAPSVPEPGTLLLLGGGLFGLAVYGKRRMNRES